MNVKRIAFIVAPLALLAALSCGPVWAHHGGAAYDRSKPVTLKATVKEFRFINPHVQIYFDAADDKGNVSSWAGEFPWDPGMLSRYGWSRNSIKAGDLVTIIGHQAKSGAPVISVSKVILADGKEMSATPTSQP
jgi:hypothetical protein